MSPDLRPTAVAGRFYPAQAAALRHTLDELFAAVPKPPVPVRAPKILVVPHAGYIYSGPTAAQGYASLGEAASRIRRVLLLGPAHRVALTGIAWPSVAAFDSPLGAIAIDQAAIAALRDLPFAGASDAAHAQEHALEVQLPFLQRVLPAGFTLLPLVVGRVSPQQVAQLLERLWGGDETLIVISTDLSHYLPYGEAQAKDRDTLAQVLRLDPALTHDQACGATPLAGALVAARAHGLQPRLIDARTSGDTAGDKDRVVGYAALVLEPASVPPAMTDDLQALGRALLTQARHQIARALGQPSAPPTDHPALAQPGAVFVTLTRQGRLRGCIGSLVATRALGEDVRQHARNAAFKDPRFPPLTAAEWPDTEVEISLLAPPEPFPVADEADACARLQPGVDGVILSWGPHRSTFLPQVWEQIPNPREFLAALKRKAGLAPDFWAPDLQLQRYRVRKFVAAKS
ncbi:AmmeMemoRadiSam system protein B [Inhella gelatinilytica]|uniref:MEMO1 family protein I7X43_04180 n=1 Tax=Inhella gelatinilytica TaxID=2795030 RepID=A0A931IU76_9BURK|nr:AmmeMemoRadiSam system protein B [Inhella gelatinilytica]MBH9552042.1 AmmeMemoRadiSam system protein B [Inhella gelatinilytica]